MVLVVSYLVLLVSNSVVLFLAHALFPKMVVLGTGSLSVLWAVALSMGALSLLNTFAIPFVRVVENNRKKMFSTAEWMLSYFILNFVGVWLISRAAEQFGLGVSSWVVVLLLALVFDMVQGMVMMQLERMRLMKK